ncbi:MAG: hypothetical protein OJF62_003008 [Pseudolabrys sp.]|jgi:nitroreductase|nr:hypothetical protein [Pseudolabrys sp.]
MDLREAIYTRRAVRNFSSKAVDDATIRQLIDAAIQAPSAMNEQPYCFIVVRAQGLLDRVSAAVKTFTLKTTAAGLLPPHLEETLHDSKFQIFYHAPVLILISSMNQGPWAAIDCALAAENLMLAARGAGLGTCWIGFAQGWLATPEGKSAFGLPQSYLPVAPIIVGYPQVASAPVPRKEPTIQYVNG